MKKFFGLLFVACGLMIYSACTENVDESLLNNGEKSEGKFEVSLNLGGDFLTTYTTSLTRADAKKKIYGVNVLYCHKADTTDKGEYTNYKPYAYGIFNDLNSIKISLSDSYVYKFECTAVQDDRNELFYWTDQLNRDIYGFPFVNMKSFSEASVEQLTVTANKNKFIFTHDYPLTEIKKGKSWVKPIDNGLNLVVSDVDTYSLLDYPATDRFYGELQDFVVSGTTAATINLKRTAFALDIKVEGFNGGSLNISCDKMLDIDIPTNGLQFESLYSFDDVYNCWLYSTKSYDLSKEKEAKQWETDSTKYLARTLNFTFLRTREDGTSQSFVRTIDVERNKKTHVIVQAENMSDDPVVVTDNETIEEGETVVVK